MSGDDGRRCRWADLATDRPELAREGLRLLTQFGPGLGFLATVRADGGPRLHPVCPIVVDGGLWVFVGPSPKRDDLLRDGRYALHTFPSEDRDDEFFVAGRVTPVRDPTQIARADTVYRAQGTTHGDEDQLFQLGIERALHSAYKPRDGSNTWPPAYTRWRAP